MSIFETELDRIFGKTSFQRFSIQGKDMVAVVDDDLIAKIVMFESYSRDTTDSIKVNIISRTNGIIDQKVFKFRDIIGGKQIGQFTYYPQIDTNLNRIKDWGAYKPNNNDRAKLRKAVLDYINIFRVYDEGRKNKTKDSLGVGIYDVFDSRCY